MIYTVTFNPAIDYVMNVSQLISGETNRSTEEHFSIGGKGINVSLVLKQLETESVALGFCAGFTGRAILDGLDASGIRSDFCILKSGNTRINVKLRSTDETEINGQGPSISSDDVAELFGKLDALKAGDVIILAGSIPKSLPDDIYEQILSRLEGKNVLSVVDATGRLLENVLKYRPFLIKPNIQELGEIFGQRPETHEEVIDMARRLQKCGAVNVLVSMADKGALLIDEFSCSHFAPAKHGKAVNSVGAGDSMVAGFISEYLKTNDYAKALRMGTAAGAATAFSQGLATTDKIFELLNTP